MLGSRSKPSATAGSDDPTNDDDHPFHYLRKGAEAGTAGANKGKGQNGNGGTFGSGNKAATKLHAKAEEKSWKQKSWKRSDSKKQSSKGSNAKEKSSSKNGGGNDAKEKSSSKRSDAKEKSSSKHSGGKDKSAKGNKGKAHAKGRAWFEPSRDMYNVLLILGALLVLVFLYKGWPKTEEPADPSQGPTKDLPVDKDLESIAGKDAGTPKDAAIRAHDGGPLIRGTLLLEPEPEINAEGDDKPYSPMAVEGKSPPEGTEGSPKKGKSGKPRRSKPSELKGEELQANLTKTNVTLAVSNDEHGSQEEPSTEMSASDSKSSIDKTGTEFTDKSSSADEDVSSAQAKTPEAIETAAASSTEAHADASQPVSPPEERQPMPLEQRLDTLHELKELKARQQAQKKLEEERKEALAKVEKVEAEQAKAQGEEEIAERTFKKLPYKVRSAAAKSIGQEFWAGSSWQARLKAAQEAEQEPAETDSKSESKDKGDRKKGGRKKKQPAASE